MNRFILHCDLNNFYASVECLYNPTIRNKAVVVVGDQDKRHGIVLAKNYIAKKYNIKTGDTVYLAKQKCQEELITVTADFSKYQRVSKIVKDIYRGYTDRVESFGIDEAWLDITGRVKNFEQAVAFAEMLRKQIVEEIGITISVGVSFNKVFAKLGSDYKKPNATTLISPENYKEIVWKLPAEDLLYVGNKTKQLFKRFGINTIGDLARTDLSFIKKILGKVGETLWNFANGNDDSIVKKVGESTEIKSVGNSTTCPHDLTTIEEIKAVIYILSESVAQRLREKNLYGTTISLFIKDDSLSSFERQKSIETPTNLASDIAKICMELFTTHFTWDRVVRCLGVRMSNFKEKSIQDTIFNDIKNFERKESMERTIENLRERFGYNIIKRGVVMGNEELADINPHDEVHKIHPVGTI